MGGIKVKKQMVPSGATVPATETAADAIKQYLELRDQVAKMRAKMVRLSHLIQKEGCGYAHGHLTFVYVPPTLSGLTKTKAHPQLKFIKYAGEDTTPGGENG